MKTIVTCAMLAIFGIALVGCESDNSGPKHEVTDQKTVTDANGHVIQQTKTHTDTSTDNNQ